MADARDVAFFPLTIIQGASLDKTFTWKDSAGNLINTGATAKMQIRKRHDAADPALVTLTEVDGITLGGAAGTVRIQRTAAQTAAYSWGSGVYDLELTALGKRFLEGPVVVSPEVTK